MSRILVAMSGGVDSSVAAALLFARKAGGMIMALVIVPLAMLNAFSALGAGFASVPMRTTANAVFTVLEGEGMTTAGGCELRWERGDVLAVPAWRQYQHVATSDAVLVRVSDDPVMRAFDLLRRPT